MSDPKIPSRSDVFEREFEKFLCDEDTPVAAIYRKLPHAEPDTQLDARVRAIAQRAVRERPSSVGGAELPNKADTTHMPMRRAGRHWIRVFASAAVLVLAAGITWRLGPNDWTRREQTENRGPTAAMVAKAPPPDVDAVQQPSANAHSVQSSAGKAQASEAGSILPASESASPFARSPPASPAAAASSAEPQPADALHADVASVPAAAETNASALARKPLVARELPGRSIVEHAAPLDERERNPFPDRGDRHDRTPPSSSNSAQTQSRAPMVAPATQMSTPASRPPPPYANASAALVEDAASDKQEAEIAEKSLVHHAETPMQTATVPASSPPPPPAAPAPAAASVHESRVAAAQASANAADAAAAPRRQPDEAAQKQAFADLSAIPPEAPKLNPPGRPTPAELAAWPPPNCHAVASGTADHVAWHYPPEVPGTPELRFALVKIYLDLDSSQAAAKAYADFRHCYPSDHWPLSLTRRLGAR